jgi:hypothetical protein
MTKKPEVTLEHQKIHKEEEMLEWLCGSPDEVIEQVRAIKEKYSQWNDLTISYEWTGYEDCEYSVTGYLLESDEDYEERIQEEKEALQLWEQEEAVRLDQQRIKQEEKKQAKIAEQLRQYKLLQEALKKEGVLE